MYSLIFKKDASKYYKKCDQKEKSRLNKVFDSLEKNGIANLDCKELKGELNGLKRIRVGDPRIIIEEKMMNLLSYSLPQEGMFTSNHRITAY